MSKGIHQFIYSTWIWHVRSSVFFPSSLRKFMETLTVKKRKEDGSMEELRPKKATLDKTTLKTILHWIWGQCRHHLQGPVSKTADILHCLQINQLRQQQVINKGCLVFAKTSTEPYWPHHHHGSLRWISWKSRRPWMKNMKSLFQRAKLF